MIDLPRFVSALDAAPERVPVFFRDDDAGWSPGAMLDLADRFVGRSTLDVAVIPMAVNHAHAAAMLARRELLFHQHGFAHVSHEQRGRKYEFGPSRSSHEIASDIVGGWSRLQTLFGERLEPVFTPPWNRCTSDTCAALVDAGFEVLSRDRGASHVALHGLVEVSVSVDWERHRSRLDEALAAAVADPPVGVMLHHAVMSAVDLDAVSRLLDVVCSHTNVELTSISRLASEAVLR